MQEALFDPANPPSYDSSGGDSSSVPHCASGGSVNDLGPGGFWDDAPVISRYTREQAVQDGVLVDVTETAREAGFKHSVALTAAVYSDVKDVPVSKKGIEDEKGRLWDLLWMSVHAVRAAATCRQEGPAFVSLVMPIGRCRNYRAKIAIGPGDDGELVLTVMRPDED